MQSTLTQIQVTELQNMIYESLISNPEFGLGEMGDCSEEAERITDEWIENNNITIIN
jgi:hypothetical protein